LQSIWAIDLFADRDLKRLCLTATCPAGEFPAGFAALVDRFPAGPLLYTGGLENDPATLGVLAASRPLLGNGPDVLHKVRNPFFLHDLGPDWTPRLVQPGSSAPESGAWLRKPYRSASGHGIRLAAPGEKASPTHYFQEFIPGPAMSAQFASIPAGQGNRERTLLLGVTEQIIGRDWLHARPFAYCGNIGMASLGERVRSSLLEIGCGIARATGLRGVWGFDFVLHDDQPRVLEVNPRYTAGMEVLELEGSFSSMTLHLECYDEVPHGSAAGAPPSLAAHVGKAIYYAARHLVFPADGPWDADLDRPFDPWRVPGYADIPEPGATIEAGWPVLTLFATGSGVLECRERLQSRAEELDSLLGEVGP
jgi:predicted ATP-grasp superfamily ATP-dependent carboligase